MEINFTNLTAESPLNPDSHKLALFFFYSGKGSAVKRKTEISNLTVGDIVYLVMSNTGMTREQAAITVQNIISYMREHTTEPLHKIVQHFFGHSKSEERRARLN